MAAVTVTTSTASYATLGGRHVDVDADGNIWVMCYSLANTRMEFWYSTDSGVSFTENTSLRTTVAANKADQGGAFYIAHDIGGECVAVWGSAGSGAPGDIYYCRSFSTSSTAWVDTTVNIGTGYYLSYIGLWRADSDAYNAIVRIVRAGSSYQVNTTTFNPSTWAN
jgi:hypothetical protein